MRAANLAFRVVRAPAPFHPRYSEQGRGLRLSIEAEIRCFSSCRIPDGAQAEEVRQKLLAMQKEIPDFDGFTSTFPEQESSNDPSEIRVGGSGYRTCCRGTGRAGTDERS